MGFQWQTTNWVMKERKCWVNHWKSTQHFCISICGVFGFHVIDGWKELLMNQKLTDNGIGPEGAKSISESLRVNGKVWHLNLQCEWFIRLMKCHFEKTKEHIYEWQTTRLVMKAWNHWVKCWNWTPHWQLFTCKVNGRRKETQNEWIDIMCFDLVFRQWNWKWRGKST